MFDLVGVGFGPANMGLCIALHESETAKQQGFSMCFLERQPQFAWHPSLLLPGAQLQVSPLKDLATMRDPTSSFTFLNYLHSQGRLVGYINREDTIPSRREWSAYLAWAARRMHQYVRYGTNVLDIRPVHGTDGKVSFLRISYQDDSTGEVSQIDARNVAIAVGGNANVPRAFESLYAWPPRDAQRAAPVVHSSTFLPQMEQLGPLLHRREAEGKHLRLAVVGGGQSAAEMLRYLHDRYPLADIDMVFRASALSPSDDSPFVNSAAFDPDASSQFWELPAAYRREVLREFKRTNYSVVNPTLLSELYDLVYDQTVDLPGPPRGSVRILPRTRVDAAEHTERGVRLHLASCMGDEACEADYDGVFLGTGFVRNAWRVPFVRSLAPHFLLLSEQGSEQLNNAQLQREMHIRKGPDADAERAAARGITRDYRLVPAEPQQWQADREMLSSAAHRILDASHVNHRIQHEISGQRAQSSGSLSSGPQSVVSDNDSAVSGSQVLTPASTCQSEAEGDDARHGAPPAVYLMGCNEATHGLADSLMSMVAHRAGVVAASILERPGNVKTAADA